MLLPLLILVLIVIAAVVQRSRRRGLPIVRPSANQSAGDALADAVARWEQAGIIDGEQGRRIVVVEGERREAVEPRMSMAAEAVGYLGGALVIIGGIVALGQVWEDLPPAVRIAAAATGTVILIGAGAVVKPREEPAYERLTSSLWLLAIAAAAFTGGQVAYDARSGAPGIVLSVGLTALVIAVVLWLLHAQPLQHVAVLAAAVTTACGIVAMFGEPESPVPYGVAVWLVGAGWVALSRSGRMPPAVLGALLGGLAMLTGSQAITGYSDTAAPGLVVGLVTVAGFFVLALAWREPALLGLGVVGVFWFVPQSVVYFVGDALGVALTLTLVGVALLASAALLMPVRDRLGHAWRRRPRAVAGS